MFILLAEVESKSISFVKLYMRYMYVMFLCIDGLMISYAFCLWLQEFLKRIKF